MGISALACAVRRLLLCCGQPRLPSDSCLRRGCWSAAAAAAAAGKQDAQAKNLSTGAHKLLALAGSLKCVLAAGEFFCPPLCLLSLSVQWGGCAPSYVSPLICISGGAGPPWVVAGALKQ